MGFERKAKRAVVIHHVLRQRHQGQQHLLFIAGLRSRGMIEQRQWALLRKPAHFPQSLTAVEPERTEGIGSGELLNARAADTAPSP
jgi:hypothetical protein